MEKEDLKFIIFLNIGFSLFEIVGGFLTGSIAISSYAIHDFFNALSIALSSFLNKISLNEPDKKYTFGYKRFTLLGTIFTSGILFTCAVLILFYVVLKFFNPIRLNVIGMIIFALIGIIINGYAMIQMSKEVNKDEKKVNWSIVCDVMGWVLLLILALVIKITNIFLLDLIVSLFIALFIGGRSIRQIIKGVDVIMNATPTDFDLDEIKLEISRLPFILDILDIHVWSIDEQENYLLLKVKVSKNVTRKNYSHLKKQIEEKIGVYRVHHSNIEIEYEESSSN
ncbi:MAG: cation transporter [Bacilli bacterium]|nr:cation transporter [Bacilli bacterium]